MNTNRSLVFAMFAVGTLGFSACGDDDGGTACDSGETQPCTCTDGSSGAQDCLDDGTGWTDCECSSGDTDSDTDSDSDSDTDSDSDADTDTDPDCVVFDDHCYWYYDTATTQVEARATCTAAGADLVTVTSAAENDFVTSLAPTTGSWLALTDEEDEGTWTWLTDEPLSYSNWCSGQPDGDTVENCAGTSSGSSPSGCWHDNPCNSTSAATVQTFVCERAL